MKLTRVWLVLSVLSLHLIAPTGTGAAKPAAARASVLLDIEVERAAGETRVHLKTDGAITDYREVKLKKNVAADRPDRMYLDLKDLRLSGPIPDRQVGTALAQVRNALRPDGVRVVFDSNRDELFSYAISQEPNGLVVAIREPGAAPPPAIAAVEPVQAAVAEPAAVIVPAVVTVYPEAKAAGDLDLLIVAAENPEQTKQWLDSTPDSRSGLQIIKRAKPDQVITTSFLVTGVSPDRNGDYSVAVSFTLLDPAGKVVVSERRFATTSGRAPANPAFIMAEPELAFTLDKTDPAGDYMIICLAEDLGINKTVRSSLRIALGK